MSKVSKRLVVRMPTAAEDKAITAAAKSDPDAPPLTPAQLEAMVPLRSLRGRPKSENKKLLVSVRYSPEVVLDAYVDGQAPTRQSTRTLRDKAAQRR